MKKSPSTFVIPLAHPIAFAKDGFPTVITTLTVRKPTREEARLLSDRVGLDQTFALLATLSDVPIASIEDLRARDFYAVCQALAKI